MSIFESSYLPKSCAFHPKESIYNFCKNSECLLPLCPSCVKVHTEEHKIENTYGQFENIHKVVSDLTTILEGNVKDLCLYEEEIKDHFDERKVDESEVRRKMKEAKEKVIGLVETFFQDFEKEVNKSITAYNTSMKENYHDINVQISTLKGEINSKKASLGSDKVLKTLISYYSKEQEKRIENNLDVMRENIDICGSKRMSLICDSSSIQKIVNQLTQYMSLTFQNWENDIKYVTEFVKTGFTNTPGHSRECSFATN